MLDPEQSVPTTLLYVEVFKGGFEDVLLSLLTAMGAISHVVLHRGFSLANVH